MKVLVCGGRNFDDQKFVSLTLTRLDREKKITEIINGGAAGADQCARRWANFYKVKLTTINADWENFGRSAGPIRNMVMIDLKPKLIVAFPGGKGTEHMKKIARSKGIKVVEIK